MNKIRGNVVSTNMSPDKISQRICVEVDSTLAKEGMPADAKAVGDRISEVIDDTGDRLQALNERVRGVEVKVVTDKTLTVLHRAADSATVGNRFGVVENAVSDLTYRIGINDSKINNLTDRVGALEDASSGVTEVYAAEYDLVENELISNFSEMVAAYKAGKIVTLTGTNYIGNIDTLLCNHYDPEETSAYEGECLMFTSCGAGYTRTVYVTSNGIADDLTTSIINLKIDVDNIKEDMGDIDAALDAIIAIQNSLIGGEGA